MADKHFERVVSLATLMIQSNRPVTFEKIQHLLHGYRGKQESAARKFERDKDELRAMGLDIVVEQDGEGKQGYVVKEHGKTLQLNHLKPEELTALRMCARGSRLAQALGGRYASTKLETQAEDGHGGASLNGILQYHQPLESGHPKVMDHLESLADALKRRKKVNMAYSSERRESRRVVEPYGMFLEKGRWHMVGFDHLTQERRIFLLRRVKRLAINPKKPSNADYRIPGDFVLGAHMNVQPWEYSTKPAQAVTARFDAAIASWVGLHLGDRVKTRVISGGRMEAVIPVRNVARFVRWILPYGAKAEVLSPPVVRQAVIEAFQTVRALH